MAMRATESKIVAWWLL